MSDIRSADEVLTAALRRLDDDMAAVRQATICLSQITFEPVDLTQTDSPSSSASREQEFRNRLADLMNEWHEDKGWATTMPEDVRADLVGRVRRSIDDDVAKGRLQ
jgi:hypothetical protein